MTTWAEIARQVRHRAAGRCEFCRMHESLQGATFHIEHVFPRHAGGESVLENLAYACPIIWFIATIVATCLVWAEALKITKSEYSS